MRSLWLLPVLGVLVAACSPSDTRISELLPPAERDPAPAVVAQTLEGDELALADLDGVVVVNFWASWCGPCIAEAPELRNVALGYADRGVHVVGVNVRDNATNARRFEADLEIPYPSWADPASTIAADFGGLGPAALPSTIVLDAEHRVAVRLIGAVSFTQLRGFLEPLLEEAPQEAPAVGALEEAPQEAPAVGALEEAVAS